MNDQRAEALSFLTELRDCLALGYEQCAEGRSTLKKIDHCLDVLADASAAPQEPPHGWEVWGGPKNGAPIPFYGYARTLAEANDLMGRHEFWEWKTVPVYLSAPQPQAAPQEPVAFYGPDKDNPTKGASLPMIPDSWRFRIREQGGAIFIEAQDNGPWIPYAAVEPYLDDARNKVLEEAARQIEEADVTSYRWEYARIVRALRATSEK